jgi:hypothetical protein
VGRFSAAPTEVGRRDAAAYRSLNIRRRTVGHWKQEPGTDGELGQPTVFPEALSLLRAGAGWTDAEFSATAGLPIERLAELLPEDFAREPRRSVTLRRIK